MHIEYPKKLHLTEKKKNTFFPHSIIAQHRYTPKMFNDGVLLQCLSLPTSDIPKIILTLNPTLPLSISACDYQTPLCLTRVVLSSSLAPRLSTQ